jgi:hypothetical protein
VNNFSKKLRGRGGGKQVEKLWLTGKKKWPLRAILLAQRPENGCVED